MKNCAYCTFNDISRDPLVHCVINLSTPPSIKIKMDAISTYMLWELVINLGLFLIERKTENYVAKYFTSDYTQIHVLANLQVLIVITYICLKITDTECGRNTLDIFAEHIFPFYHHTFTILHDYMYMYISWTFLEGSPFCSITH